MRAALRDVRVSDSDGERTSSSHRIWSNFRGAFHPKKENGRTFPAPLCEAFDGGSVEWLSWRFLPAEEEFDLFWQAR